MVHDWFKTGTTRRKEPDIIDDIIIIITVIKLKIIKVLS